MTWLNAVFGDIFALDMSSSLQSFHLVIISVYFKSLRCCNVATKTRPHLCKVNGLKSWIKLDCKIRKIQASMRCPSYLEQLYSSVIPTTVVLVNEWSCGHWDHRINLFMLSWRAVIRKRRMWVYHILRPRQVCGMTCWIIINWISAT